MLAILRRIEIRYLPKKLKHNLIGILISLSSGSTSLHPAPYDNYSGSSSDGLLIAISASQFSELENYGKCLIGWNPIQIVDV